MFDTDSDAEFERLCPSASTDYQPRKKRTREPATPDAIDMACAYVALDGDEFRAKCRATLKRMRWAFGR